MSLNLMSIITGLFLGMMVGWLVRFFIHRFNEYTVKILASLLALIIAGVATSFLVVYFGHDITAFFSYFIGIFIGLILIYDLFQDVTKTIEIKTAYLFGLISFSAIMVSLTVLLSDFIQPKKTTNEMEQTKSNTTKTNTPTTEVRGIPEINQSNENEQLNQNKVFTSEKGSVIAYNLDKVCHVDKPLAIAYSATYHFQRNLKLPVLTSGVILFFKGERCSQGTFKEYSVIVGSQSRVDDWTCYGTVAYSLDKKTKLIWKITDGSGLGNPDKCDNDTRELEAINR